MRLKSTLFTVAVSVVAAIALGGMFYLGFAAGARNPKVITVKGITNIGDEDVTADFGVFWQVWDYIKKEHVNGTEAKDQNLVYGAVSGLVDSLQDPNTNFFSPEDTKKFLEDVSGSFGGIGAEIGVRNDQLVIVAPLKGSPAEKAGLRSGDKILKVGDSVSIDMQVTEAVKLIRGDPGTTVILTITRNGWSKPQEISITRDIIKVPTLELEIKDVQLAGKSDAETAVPENKEIAHIKLYSFNENSIPLFQQAMLKALLAGAKGMILDLRNNPGGYLEVAVNLAGWFLPRGSVVVTEDFRTGEDTVFRANGNEALKDFPVVALINGGSASASEILAGALRDHRDIKLIGEKSFGKGTVQELKTLKDNSSLKLTIAQWLLPSGKTIEKNGLVPDIEVKLTEDDIEAKRDPQLDKAFEVLKSLLE
ncbi:MAG: S41 family peptidase [Patescibacteria group bacterium]